MFFGKASIIGGKEAGHPGSVVALATLDITDRTLAACPGLLVWLLSSSRVKSTEPIALLNFWSGKPPVPSNVFSKPAVGAGSDDK